MLELHHNAASSCSQKVRLVLAEKGLDYESRVVDLLAGGQHDPAYVKLNPNHVVPTLVHDGRVLIESSLINEYLEDVFPDVPMRPADPAARHATRLWVKGIDEKVHPAAGVLTYAIGPRKLVLAQPEEAREKLIEEIPDPERRAQRRSVIEHGVRAPEFAGALGAFLGLLDRMEAHVPVGGWLSGDTFGLADAAALPYVLRLDHLGLGRVVEARPAAADWLARVQARPSYEPAVGSWLPQPMIDLFRKNGEEVWADIEPLDAGVSEADALIERLGLQPHPEGGHFAETWRGPGQPRAAGTAIYFLLRAGERSHWHRVDATEIWHFYRGAPLALEIALDGEERRTVTLGPSLEAGEVPQAIVPPHAWQSARSLGDYTLVGCTVSPGFDFAGFELAPDGWEP